jgi:acetyl-CoA C-acetyltransferase
VTLDDRTPVIVGAGQVLQRIDEGEGREPVELLADAFLAAGEDAGGSAGSGLLAAADSIRVVQILSWRYRDPGRLVADRLGARPRHTLYTGSGGQLPQALVGRAAHDIAAGRADVVLVGGAETWRSRTRIKAAGGHRGWARQPDEVEPTELVDADAGARFSHPAELAAGVALPVQQYPLIESALRTAAGRTPTEHERVVAELWSRFSRVAADNPNAWDRRAYSADELLAAGPDNRMVALPYRKRWCSNNQVDMAAGILVCSAERAAAMGVPRDWWVFPVAGATTADPLVSQRADLARSPALRAAGRQALAQAGASIDDVAHVDLYSCFPSAVELAAGELGLPLDDESRPLTVTGGLAFAGGPWNNYGSHALATMVDRLRADPGSLGLVTGLGGFATKHTVAIYGTEPPVDGFRWDRLDPDPTPQRPVAAGYAGPATIEAWTVIFDRDGRPETGITTCLTPDGERAWATTTEPDALATLTTEDVAGVAARITGARLDL